MASRGVNLGVTPAAQTYTPPGLPPAAQTYTALGGSNTCGHGLKHGAKSAFQQLVHHGLAERSPLQPSPVALQPSCVPAMGPDYPASCLAYFSPNTTRWATLEFTPNMDEGRELSRNELVLTHIATRLRARGVAVVFVSLVPRPPTCASCIRMFEEAHAAVGRVAKHTRLPLVTMLYEPETWSDDLKHLNEAGHKKVAEAVLNHFAQAPATPLDNEALSIADGSTEPECVFGADLAPLMLPGSRGFSLTWQARFTPLFAAVSSSPCLTFPFSADASQAGKHRDKPGLIATEPDALLRLCVRGLPPSFGISLALERSDVLPMSNVTLGCEAGCTCPLELLSNGDWTLRYRGKGTRRASESYMHRVFGARHGAPHDGRADADHGCDCVLTMRNTPVAGKKLVRAKINGLVAGGSGAIGWANRFHMNLNPNVLSG